LFGLIRTLWFIYCDFAPDRVKITNQTIRFGPNKTGSEHNQEAKIEIDIISMSFYELQGPQRAVVLRLHTVVCEARIC